MNVETFQWFADIPAISQFFQPLPSCNSGGLTILLACNPALDRAATIALNTQTADPGEAQRRWQRIYNDVDKDARIVANSTAHVYAIFHAKRVGNTHFTPFSGPLFDQMWVR